MQLTYLAVPLFAALAAAQSNSTSLADLVAQLPTCASSCLESGASSAGCNVTDFTCLCGTGKSSFITAAGICVATSSCTSEEQKKVQTLAGEICSDATSASSSELASASAVATSILATATGASATSTTGSNAAAATAVGYGLMGGAAALIAFAL